MTPDKKLQLCKETREAAANSLYEALQDLLQTENPISEKQLRDAWLKRLQKNDQLFPQGWYDPPPGGIAVLFATETDIDRVSPKNIRLEEFWPRKNIYLDRTGGLAFIYASPIAKETGLIGDFGMTLYFGKNEKIKQHIRKAYRIVFQLFNQIEVGMQLSNITGRGKELLAKENLFSELASPSDPTGTNIGHTIPFSYEGPTEEEQKTINGADKDWSHLKELIRAKRKFLNEIETFSVKPGMAFTLEPRPQSVSDPKPPMVWFHSLVLIDEKGKKQLLTNFAKIFSLIGMEYLQKVKS